MEEQTVPTFGFKEVGRTRHTFGDYDAVLNISSQNTCEISWFDNNGKRLSAAPAAVKESHLHELKKLKQTIAEVDKLLTSLRQRIDSSLLRQRNWNFEAWRQRLLDHPICGALTRRLIWSFNGKSGVWCDGQIVDVNCKPLGLTADTIVELWHPISTTTSEVLAWRRWFSERSISQPFKQAHREIYLLTDAERMTGTYSNRFAAHILRQHQFAEVCGQRGWNYTLQGQWDSHNTPTLRLPRWNVEVEFWVDGFGSTTASALGVYTTVATDQVRFVRPGTQEPVNLTEISPLLFSEAMRDVDLFVGVCSIGNDPNWQEGGQLGTYWHDYSFGHLSASASTRRDALKQIIPHLAIADRCHFTDKYLVVRGNLGTYSIHLGSGNIMMEPGSKYLCIVPGWSSTGRYDTSVLYLPFEGDTLMSIILSKCLFLANDDKITDVGILSQIRR